MTSNGDSIVIAELLGLVPSAGVNQARLYTVDSQGSFTTAGSPMDTAYGQVVRSGFFSDQGYVNLAFLNISSGQLRLYAVSSDNSFTLISDSTPRVPPVSNLWAGSFHPGSPYTDLMSWNNGKGQFYATDGKGGLSPIGAGFEYSDTTAAIVVGHFDLNTEITDLLFFDTRPSRVSIFTTDGKGNIKQIGQQQTISGDWAQVVIGNFGGGTGCSDLLFLSDAGQYQFFKTPGDGTLVPIADPSDEGMVISGFPTTGAFAGNTTFDDLIIAGASGKVQIYQTDGKGKLETVGPEQSWPDSTEFYSIAEVR